LEQEQGDTKDGDQLRGEGDERYDPDADVDVGEEYEAGCDLDERRSGVRDLDLVEGVNCKLAALHDSSWLSSETGAVL